MPPEGVWLRQFILDDGDPGLGFGVEGLGGTLVFWGVLGLGFGERGDHEPQNLVEWLSSVIFWGENESCLTNLASPDRTETELDLERPHVLYRRRWRMGLAHTNGSELVHRSTPLWNLQV